ncbi:hypothetical protein SAMN04488552_2896 [Christiangramia echinicola]|uniref:Uncharacterized protein n=1 Tax=Christiangramia echinicola TaxID=279359 RepID=A0A1H1RHQ4_9FLAO|nr:hypothetical protein SAMN04488552_2896 [Christiangramia echinicola]
MLDKRNLEMWNYVLKNYKIQLKKSSEDNYITRYSNDSVTICINEENIHPAPFTHELLHIYLKVKKNFIASELSDKIEEYPQLYFLFSHSLKNHIGNCLEHGKILPLFLNMGFKKEDFVSDYDEIILTKEEVDNLKLDFLKDNIYSRQAVDIYIGKYFSMKSNSNEQYDYQDHLKAFENLEPSLFHILNDFWISWSQFNIETTDSYRGFLESFLGKLDLWMGRNTVI